MKKIALSLMVAGVVSSAFASEAANLANIAPTNHDKVAIALDTYYKGIDIWGASSFALGFDGKYGLVQAANGELYFRLAGHAGVRSKDVHRFLEIGGNMKENIILDENALSPWLKKDLKKFLDCKNSNVNPNWDLSLYWSELYTSINISQLSKEITKEQAEYLRRKYLGIC